jgi:hypothetical protein
MKHLLYAAAAALALFVGTAQARAGTPEAPITPEQQAANAGCPISDKSVECARFRWTSILTPQQRQAVTELCGWDPSVNPSPMPAAPVLGFAGSTISDNQAWFWWHNASDAAHEKMRTICDRLRQAGVFN